MLVHLLFSRNVFQPRRCTGNRTKSPFSQKMDAHEGTENKHASIDAWCNGRWWEVLERTGCEEGQGVKLDGTTDGAVSGAAPEQPMLGWNPSWREAGASAPPGISGTRVCTWMVMGAKEKAAKEDKNRSRARPQEALSLMSPEQRCHVATNDIRGLCHRANWGLRPGLSFSSYPHFSICRLFQRLGRRPLFS